jgi:hypothetical protein
MIKKKKFEYNKEWLSALEHGTDKQNITFKKLKKTP